MKTRPRPCRCDRVRPGEPFDPARDCPHCYAYHHHPHVRAAWGGPARTAAQRTADGGTASGPSPAPPPRAATPARPPCRHELAVVVTCSRGEDYHVRGCAKHGRCARRPNGRACTLCATCPDHDPAAGGPGGAPG